MPSDSAAGVAEAPNELAELATVCKLDPKMLRQVAERLQQDAQVRLVWLLYQLETDGPVSSAQGVLELPS